ncbi:MAG TPA: hypothetical protein VF629_15655 [Hymenobacter sp.]|jgi:hypothetical protein|uniref:hypothetical protein n=1 Tax=Hymenobacter sp. TaxID=1898978 RepID=UPI002EDB2089
MHTPTTLAHRQFLVALFLALNVLGWASVVLFVYTSRTTWSGEYGTGVTYETPVVPLAAGLLATVLYWLGLSLLAVYDKKRRRFFVKTLLLAVAFFLTLSVTCLVLRMY